MQNLKCNNIVSSKNGIRKIGIQNLEWKWKKCFNFRLSTELCRNIHLCQFFFVHLSVPIKFASDEVTQFSSEIGNPGINFWSHVSYVYEKLGRPWEVERLLNALVIVIRQCTFIFNINECYSTILTLNCGAIS